MNLPRRLDARRLKIILFYLLFFAVFEFLLFHYFVLIKVDGSSMEPTLHDGDRIVIRSTDKLANGQVVIFAPPPTWVEYAHTDPDTKFVKRLLAGPGDSLSFDGRTFFVNGEAKTTGPRYSCLGEDFEVKLTSDQMFVVGDNAGVSVDSRRIFCDGLPYYLLPVQNITYSGKILWNF